MRRALEWREAHRSEIEEHVDADTAFHRSVVVAAHNPLLVELFDGFVPRSRQAMVEMLRIRGAFGSDADHDVHSKLLKAVADRDSDLAAKLSRTHLIAMKDALGTETMPVRGSS